MLSYTIYSIKMNILFTLHSAALLEMRLSSVMYSLYTPSTRLFPPSRKMNCFEYRQPFSKGTHKMNIHVMIPSILLSQYQYYTVKGEKALHFLQGQLTCDLNTLENKRMLMGGYLNLKGRIVASVRIFFFNHSLILQIPTSISDSVIPKLQRMAKLSKVTFEPCPELITKGVMTANISNNIISSVMATENDSVMIEKKDCVLMRVSKAGLYLAVGTQTAVEALMPDTCEMSDKALWMLTALKAHDIDIGLTLSDLLTPHDLDWIKRGYVSLTKGCYVGQEIVARMQYLGKTKYSLSVLMSKAYPKLAPRDNLFNEKEERLGTVLETVNQANRQDSLVLLKTEAKQTVLYTAEKIRIEQG